MYEVARSVVDIEQDRVEGGAAGAADLITYVGDTHVDARIIDQIGTGKHAVAHPRRNRRLAFGDHDSLDPGIGQERAQGIAEPEPADQDAPRIGHAGERRLGESSLAGRLDVVHHEHSADAQFRRAIGAPPQHGISLSVLHGPDRTRQVDSHGMKPVSPLDAQFLNVEDTTTTGHVGAVVLLDPSTTPAGEISLDGLRALLEPRLHLAPPFRQRLVDVPFGLGHPYWVDDPDFDLEFHLRELALPAPGSDEQLGEQVARIHARPLDRSRPLWELYLVHGLHGDRAALYFKVHHAAIDGVTGAELLAAVMDVTPEPRALEPDDWSPRPLPGPEQLLARALASNTRTMSHALTSMPRSLPHLMELPGAANVPGARQVSDAADAVMTFMGRGGKRDDARHLFAPPTPFNGPITAHRRYSFGSLPLDDVKAVKRAYDMTVNDVVVALATGALRRWLLDHDALPELPLVAAIPVSTRDDSGLEPGNQISVMMVRIPTHLRDPAERLTYLHDEIAVAKDRLEAVPATILQDLSAALPTGLSGLASRALFRMITAPGLPFNLFVSNVPGPQLPLYVDGAAVEGIYPVSAVSQLTGGINITLFSYHGSLDFGVVVCREMMPDVWALIGYLEDALSDLQGLTG